MKRFLSVLLCICYIMCAVPVQAEAATSHSAYNQIMALGCEVFPEFAHKITNNISSTPGNTRQMEVPTVIYSETREVSNNRSLMYTELSNGAVLLAELTFEKDVHFDSLTHTNSGTIYYYTISLACNYSYGVFTLSDVEYIALNAGYAYIYDTGTPSVNYNDQCRYTAGTHRYMEDVSDYLPAQIVYSLEFDDKNYYSTNVYCGTLLIKIRGNTLTCEFDSLDGGVVN